jgi:hypothetical protein
MHLSRAVAVATLLTLAGLSCAIFGPARASAAGAPVRADALVLVSSASPDYADFQHFIQPYLDNFGVPYTVVDIATTPVPSTIGDYSLIIVGHRDLDPDGRYLSAAEQASISSAVQLGTGLVSFDNVLASQTGSPLYTFEQTVFGFGYGGATSGSGVTIASGGTTAGEIAFDCADDAHQQPVLQTTTNPDDISLVDGLWTEFHYTDPAEGRPFPSVFAGSDEYEQHGLQPMRFYATGVPNGTYAVYANVYTGDPGRDMRYYYGYSASNTRQYHVDTVGGSGGSTQHTEYALQSVTVTDNTFSLYAQDADLLSGSYPVFGWAHIRLVPTGSGAAPSVHYITSLHTPGQTIDTGTMRLAGVTAPATASVLAVSGSQPLITAASYGAGRAVQWGSYDWASTSVKGPVAGLDDLFWRSLVWAAHKPFVLQALPPIVTMRVDDAKGPFDWIHTASDAGFKPWAGLFFEQVSNSSAADLSALIHAGKATASIHAFSDVLTNGSDGKFFYYDDAGQQDFPDSVLAANFAAGTAWYQQHDIPISKFAVPHYYELGTNAVSYLRQWGVEFVGTVLKPGDPYYGSGWLASGPYRRFETGASDSTVPLYYADFLSVPGHPALDGVLFNCVTEIRDDNGYEWSPTSDVPSTIGHGTAQLERALDSRVLATLFTHEYYVQDIDATSWRAIMTGISSAIASYGPIYMTMDDACRYVRALATSSISASTYDAAGQTVRTDLTGTTDVTTSVSLFTESNGTITEQRVAVPAFSGTTSVVTSLGSGGDVTPPKVTAVSAGTPAAGSATVTWTTDEPASSQVEYGATTAYGSTSALDSTLTAGHSVVLTGLTANSIYHFRVLSRDAAGNLAASADATFTTAAPALSVNDVSVSEGNSGSSSATFTVSLSAASSAAVTVAYATSDGTARAGSDYSAASGTLTFAPGVLTRTVSVAVTGDALFEADETFALGLSSPSGASIADASGAGTIVNDDAQPSLAISDVTVNEGNSGTVNAVLTVSLSAPSGLPVNVAYATAAGTATAGADFTPTSGTLAFAPGTTSLTVSVPVLGDVLDEADETFTVGLSSASGATIADGQGVATIRDDDATPSLTVSDASVTEGDTGTTSAVFTVSLSAASGLPVTVAYATADGTAVAGGDYTATSGTLTFPAGTTTRTVSVSVLGDLVSEPTETFSLNLSQPANATLARSQGVGTITDNDAVPALSVNDVSVVEGNSGTVAAVFTVSLSAPSPLAVTVDYATADGTAAAGSDYTAKSGTLTFAAGVTTQTVSVLVTGDTVAEAAETFTLTLSHASGATVARAQGVGTIVDDDGRSISINDVSITEGNSGTANATFTVRLSSAATSTVTVAYATANGTATAGSDYTAKSGTLTFAAGATTQTVSVPVIGDTLDEADETFLVNLSSPVNATIADAQGVGTIVDNDPTPSLTVADVSVTEGNSGSVNAVFTVKLSAASGQSVSVAYATADSTATAGSDYAAKSGTLTFAPGTTSQTVSVSVLGDTTYEANETFLFNLSSPVNATLSRSQAVGTIVNDDSAPTTSVTINCWDDASQSPVLATTTNANDINLTDGRWTEFLYTSGRTFPTVCAGASEYENNGLQPMRFFKTGLANGTYQVFANLYTGDAGRNMRYYWGYSATDTKHYSVDTVGGSGGSTQHTEYLLGTVTISDGTFSLYAQDADVLSGSYSVFGWAWIRLVQTS